MLVLIREDVVPVPPKQVHFLVLVVQMVGLGPRVVQAEKIPHLFPNLLHLLLLPNAEHALLFLLRVVGFYGGVEQLPDLIVQGQQGEHSLRDVGAVEAVHAVGPHHPSLHPHGHVLPRFPADVVVD